MKTVTIAGKDYEVPDNANYIAMDPDGAWYWYSDKPTVAYSEWITYSDFGPITDDNDAWIGSLTTIK